MSLANKLLLVLIAAALTCWTGGAGVAGRSEPAARSGAGIVPNQDGKWALHFAGPHDSKVNTCDFSIAACESVAVDAPVGPGRYDVYVLAVDVEDVSATRFGLTCDGPFVFYGWTSCALLDLPTPGWPGPGEGNALTWSSSQGGPAVTLGVLDVYVYGGSSSLSTVPDPRVGFAQWCDGTEPSPVCYATADSSAFSTLGFAAPGAIDCDAVGTPSCEVSPTTLDFGTVGTDSSADLSFTIANTGTWIMSGAVSENCDYYSIVAGSEAYLLAPGESHTVTVRFSPTSIGTRVCTIETGEELCADVACTGDGLQVGERCEVSPWILSFGNVGPDSSVDKTFTITNAGTETFSTTVSESCEHYSIVSGGGTFSLEPASSRVVTVRFAPTTLGTHECTIQTGLKCADVSCSGVGWVLSCDVSPDSLDFGTVNLGSNVDKTFTITNSGSGELSGEVSESCEHFAIIGGGGSYSLRAGATRNVTVRYSPTSTGAHSCIIETGAELCNDVTCVGEAGVPSCEVSPASLDFGTVSTGSGLDLPFTIMNSGTGVLTGAVSEACGHYGIVAGGGSYSLGAGESREVTVRFSPTAPGTFHCTIETGSELCSDVSCVGLAEGPSCEIQPTSLDFGEVFLGSSSDSTFTITNTGNTTLAGTMSESCADYEIVAGGSYSLEGGESQQVTVRFAPTVEGTRNCTIDTGHGLCQDVSCTGYGVGARCEISPSSLNFGMLRPGSSLTRPFWIENTGNQTLSGTVSESCEHYSIVSGGGAYTLEPGASREVKIRFVPPSTGVFTCTVETGDALCSDMECTGEGYSGYIPNSYGKWALHYAGPHDSKAHTCDFQLYDCMDVEVQGSSDAGRYDVYVIAVDVARITATRYGLTCDGPFFFYGWTSCSDLELPTGGWPGCGEGNAQVWSTEQVGPCVTIGLLEVYMYGGSERLSAGADPRVGFAEWCDGSKPNPLCYKTSDPFKFGWIGFNGSYGYNPCGLIPVALAGFSARATDEGILLEWRPSDPGEFSHFFVHRSAGSRDGQYVRLNETALDGGGFGGAEYTYLDESVIPGTLYYYKLEGVRRDGESGFFGPYEVMASSARSHYGLYQNVPNPFSSGSTTTISYSVAEGGQVKIMILDAAGRHVRTLKDTVRPGLNSLVWDGRDERGRAVVSGVYFYEIRAGAFRAERKMLIVD